MKRILCLLLPLLLGLWALTACAPLHSPAPPFTSTHQDFLRLLRWQDYEGAAHYLEEPHRSAFLKQFRHLKDLRIVDVEPESVAPGKTENTRVTNSVISYYLLPSITVKKFRFRLKWRALGKTSRHPGAWRIVSAFPPFP